MPAISRAQFESIVEAGIWAPSADNRHQVEFEHLASGIALWCTPELADAPFHRGVLGLIGLGAVAENMLIRASSLGLSGELAWFPDSGRAALLGRLDLRPGEAIADDLDAAIPLRCTNRQPFFHGPPMSESERANLKTEVARVPGVKLLWFDRPELRRKLLRILLIAESERFRSRPLHEELFASIRFDVGWNAMANEGLPPGALGIGVPMRWAFRALRHWPLMRVLSALGMHRAIGFRAAYMPSRFAPHLCVLATTLPFADGCLAVGRALERLWLRSSGLGFAVQPFAAPGLLALDGYADVRPSIRDKLHDAWRTMTPDIQPLMVFRMGRAIPPSVRALRHSLHRYVRAHA